MNEKERQLAFEVFQERLWDEMGFRKPGDPPTNLPALYDDLGVAGATDEEKSQKVKAWLQNHEPIGLLKLQLKRMNYI